MDGAERRMGVGRQGSWTRGAWFPLAVAWMAGCGQAHGVDDAGAPIARDAGRDASVGSSVDSGHDAGFAEDGGPPDAGAIDACVAGAEACNSLDDDCDGVVDEAGAGCMLMHASAACADGACVVSECERDFADCNGEAADGCEVRTGDDPASCGTCARSCSLGVACRDGLCDDERVVRISAGYDHSCAVRASGEALCWGLNDDGQLGTRDRVERLVATPVAGGRAFIDVVAAFDFTCGILVTGGVACWGSNLLGQLGDGRSGLSAGSLEPVDAVGPAGVVELTAGVVGLNGSVLARTSAGDVWGWGENQHGELGGPPPTSEPTVVTPPSLRPLAGVASIGASNGYGCGVMLDGSLECWGTRSAPVGAGARAWRSVGAGVGHRCAIAEARELYCWGRNTGGGVGPFACTDCPSPQLLPLPEPVSSVAVGFSSTCAVLESGAPLCWGRASGSSVPSAPPGLGRTEAVSVSDWRTCALDARARVWCWQGVRVGDGTVALRDTPVEVVGLY